MSVWSLFRSSNDAVEQRSKQATRALPASWYHSSPMYELEKRAIFSRKWMVVTHQTRFINAGEYVQYKQADFPFFLVKDRQGAIRGFHNVCRHRAYPVVEGGCGKVSILACKYHGWSYGLDGKLAKAPKYQDLDGFDKSANSLFPIHVHVDELGFVWVNFDAREQPEVPWAEDLDGVDTQPRLQDFDLSQFQFDHAWNMVGDYNWKTLADNYNECYHCPTGHPALNSQSDFGKYWVETTKGHIQHWNVDKGEEGLKLYSSFYYPNASITISAFFMYIQRVVPISATQTKMEYEIYRHKEASHEEFERLNQIFKVVLREDKELCNAAQRNLETGVFLSGELHPEAEKGPLYFQQLTRELVVGHRAKEEKLGKLISPAIPPHNITSGNRDDIDFCDRLDCMSDQPQLKW